MLLQHQVILPQTGLEGFLRVTGYHSPHQDSYAYSRSAWEAERAYGEGEH